MEIIEKLTDEKEKVMVGSGLGPYVRQHTTQMDRQMDGQTDGQTDI